MDKNDNIFHITLEEHIQYQKSAVVSSEIFKNKSGTVTMFAFGEGQGLSEHKTPYDALVYVVDGEAEITVSGKSNQVIKGGMILMPANEPHALKAIKPFKMLLVMLKSI